MTLLDPGLRDYWLTACWWYSSRSASSCRRIGENFDECDAAPSELRRSLHYGADTPHNMLRRKKKHILIPNSTYRNPLYNRTTVGY
jgi:hypothetical protein